VTAGVLPEVDVVTKTCRTAQWCVFVALALTLFVNIPMFLFNTVFGDDWAWVWVHHWQGAGGIDLYMSRAGHRAFAPIFNFEFWLGGDVPGRVARVLAVAFHLGNGWLIWRVFRAGRAGTLFAATVAAFYLSSPYLGGLRGTLSHSGYDIFIFFYLLSILLTAQRGWTFLILALAAQFIGMLLETLAALEVIRWWLLYRHGYSPRALALRAAPFIVLIIGLAISRATWMAPWGKYYAGHNDLEFGGVAGFIDQIWLHLQYFTSGSLEPLHYVPHLFLHKNLSRFAQDSLLIGLPIVMFATALGVLWYRVPAGHSYRNLVELVALGILTLGAGMLPYVAIARPPYWWGFYSRLAVASQFGAFILGSAFLSMLPWRKLAAAAFAIAMLLASAMQVQFGKWMIYDDLVVQDFQSQLAEYFARNPDQLLFVRFVPDAHDVLYLRRCLANYDVNVALDIKGLRNGDYAYNVECDAASYTDDGKCGVTAFVRKPCPPMHLAEFRMRPSVEDFRTLSLIGLVRRALSGTRFDAGTLVVDPAVTPLPKAEG
jgi:hypothetical protein